MTLTLPIISRKKMLMRTAFWGSFGLFSVGLFGAMVGRRGRSIFQMIEAEWYHYLFALVGVIVFGLIAALGWPSDSYKIGFVRFKGGFIEVKSKRFNLTSTLCDLGSINTYPKYGSPVNHPNGQHWKMEIATIDEPPLVLDVIIGAKDIPILKDLGVKLKFTSGTN
ncbi:MAG: hypothetical protein ACPGU4_01645 [Flavobacteriales bacterium]